MVSVIPQPQTAEPAPLPAYPIAPSDATQTNASASGMVDPSRSPFMNTIRAAAGRIADAYHNSPESVSIPNAAMNYFVRPQNAQVAQPASASTLLASPNPALADGAFGGPPTAAPPQVVAQATNQIFGHPDHAMENPHQYDAAQWQKAFAGMPSDTFFRMMGLAHQKTMQEQAACLALSMALQGRSTSATPEQQARAADTERFLRSLAGGNMLGMLQQRPE